MKAILIKLEKHYDGIGLDEQLALVIAMRKVIAVDD